MKVYIVTGEPFPNGMAATKRIYNYSLALIEQNIEVEIVIFRRTEFGKQQFGNRSGNGIIDGITYRYASNTPIEKGNRIRKKLNRYLDQWRTINYLKNKVTSNDVILFYCGLYVDFTLSVIKHTRNNNCVYVRDLCELPYGTGKETNYTIKKRNQTFQEQFPQMDGLICISDSLVEIAERYVSPKCSITKVPILVNFKEYEINDASSNVNVPYIFHSGTLYEQKDGILGMLEAFGKATQILDFPIRFMSTGDISKSPHKDEIKDIIKKYNIEDKVIFKGYLSSDELKKTLSEASLVIINKNVTQQNTYCFSTKLGEYLAASKPVIITNVGESNNWLTNGENSIIVEPDVDNLTSAIVYSFTHLEEIKKIGINGRILCKTKFDYHAWGEHLKKYFTYLIEQHDCR